MSSRDKIQSPIFGNIDNLVQIAQKGRLRLDSDASTMYHSLVAYQYDCSCLAGPSRTITRARKQDVPFAILYLKPADH